MKKKIKLIPSMKQNSKLSLFKQMMTLPPLSPLPLSRLYKANKKLTNKKKTINIKKNFKLNCHCGKILSHKVWGGRG